MREEIKDLISFYEKTLTWRSPGWLEYVLYVYTFVNSKTPCAVLTSHNPIKCCKMGGARRLIMQILWGSWLRDYEGLGLS